MRREQRMDNDSRAERELARMHDAITERDARIIALEAALRDIPCLNELHEQDWGCEDLEHGDKCVVCKHTAALLTPKVSA